MPRTCEPPVNDLRAHRGPISNPTARAVSGISQVHRRSSVPISGNMVWKERSMEHDDMTPEEREPQFASWFHPVDGPPPAPPRPEAPKRRGRGLVAGLLP